MPVIKLHQLPMEVLSVIIQKLEINDVRNLILTCKTLKNLIINDNAIWRSISHKRLIIQGHDKNKFSEQSWYERCRISHNWCKGIYKNRGLIYFDRNYMPWLKYHNSEVLLLTMGSDLHCYAVDKNGFPNGHRCQWKLCMPKIKRYDKRTNDISRFVIKENLLVCGNRNGSVAVYLVDRIHSQPQRIQYIHDCHVDGGVEVSAVEVVNNKESAYLVTGSVDSPVVMFWNWNLDNDSADLSRGGAAGISFGLELGGSSKETTKCLALNETGDKLAIGPDGNSKPALVDVTRAEFLMKCEESSNVSQVVRDVRWLDARTLLYVTHAGRLQLMDVRTHQVVYSVSDPFEASFYCVQSSGRALLAGTSQHARCVLYDSRRPAHTQLYFTSAADMWKMSPVYSADLDARRLVAGAARAVSALDYSAPPGSPPRDYSDLYMRT